MNRRTPVNQCGCLRYMMASPIRPDSETISRLPCYKTLGKTPKRP